MIPIDPSDAAGPFPIGDPGAMRADAARLSQEAQQIGDKAQLIAGWVADMPYEGPGAVRLRSEATSLSGDLTAQAGRLSDLAAFVAAAAGQVEDQQAAWHQRFNQAQDEARTQAQAAARATAAAHVR
jgi:hypothetical protein